MNLYGNTDCGFGAMLKCSVPANTTYLIGCNEGKAYVYTDETLNTCVSDSGVLQNNSSEPKVFYIWVNTRYAVGACTLKLTFDDTVMDLTTAVKSAESLTDGDKTVFCWNDKDSGYIPCLTTINSTYPIQYKAKVYKLEKGLHKLTVHADKENVVPKLTMFETGDLFQTNLWTFEDVELANTWTTEVDVYDTAYLVLDADESNLDAEITLSLTKSDAKKVLDAKEEITKLEVGENPNTADINSYVFIIHSEDNVSGKDYDCYGACTGRWYSYTVPAYTKATITLPANGNYYLFGEDSGMYDLGEAYVPRDVEYENETDKPEMIYVALEGESDSTASIIVKTTKTREEANLLSAYKEKANELPKNQMVEIGESDAQLTAKVPQQYGEDDEKNYIEETGYLYKLQVAAKSKVEISASNARAVRIYSDPDALPVVSDEDGTASFSNLANEEKTFYIWWNGTVGASIKAAESTLDTTTTPKEDGGSKTETTIDTEVEDAKITVAEDKNSSKEVTEAVVKVEQTGGISADAIKKSIETVEQYNSDNAGKKQVTNIQATYKGSSNAIISADVLISLKKAEISLELSKKTEDGTLEYVWDFDAESLKKTDIKEEINTKLEVFKDAVNYDDKALVDNLTDPEVSKCVVAFEHNGDLPNDTKVTVPVNQYSNGTTVYYYHINKEKNALEFIADSKVTNGLVTLTLSHCSDYVMYDRKVCTHEKTKIVNAVKESCTKEGYTGDTYCSDCDKKLAEGKKIPMTDHTSSDWIVDQAATVDAAGSRHKECTVCHKVLKTEEIAKLPKPEPTPAPVVTPDVTTRYTTHVQSIGWQGDENNTAKWFTNGKMAGTSGRAKRLEGIKLCVDGNDKLGIQYTTHCQSYGWLPWSANGEMNGTEGEAKRLEAIKIQLTGADKEKYDVYYRVHAQSYGWLGWAKNGEPAGTAGYAKRLEGIQIVVVKKDTAAPGLNYAGVNAASGVHQTKTYIAKAGSSPVVGNTATSNENPKIAGDTTVNVAYRTHVQSFGWQGWKYNGQMSGTSGKAKRLEGINIKLTNKPYSGSIVYTTHVQSIGWQGDEHNQNTWMHDGQMAGTSGKAKRLEAIRINLTGEMAKHYDIYYRVHAQSFGWMNWTKNGEPAGTAGLAKRLEGIQIVIVPKGSAAPAANYGNVVSVRSQAYIKR